MHQWIIGTPTTFPVVVYVSVYKENEQMVGEKILQMELTQQHYNQSLDTLLLRALKQQRDLVLRIHKKKRYDPQSKTFSLIIKVPLLVVW